MIANSKKMKMKRSHPPTTFAFPLASPFWFSPDIFLRNGSPCLIFCITWMKIRMAEEWKTMCIHLKIYAITFDSFCVFLLENVYTVDGHVRYGL